METIATWTARKDDQIHVYACNFYVNVELCYCDSDYNLEASEKVNVDDADFTNIIISRGSDSNTDITTIYDGSYLSGKLKKGQTIQVLFNESRNSVAVRIKQ